MKRQVEGKRVAILATNGFEESELKSPKAALTEAGVKVDVVSLEKGEIRGWSNKDWSGTCPVDKVVADVKAEDYDMLVIPGGLYNPDSLRTNQDALRFTRDFFEQHKPVPRNINTPTNPGVLKFQNILQEAFQCLDASGSADNAAMQTYTHHLGCAVAFGIERIEAVF